MVGLRSVWMKLHKKYGILDAVGKRAHARVIEAECGQAAAIWKCMMKHLIDMKKKQIYQEVPEGDERLQECLKMLVLPIDDADTIDDEAVEPGEGDEPAFDDDDGCDGVPVEELHGAFFGDIDEDAAADPSFFRDLGSRHVSMETAEEDEVGGTGMAGDTDGVEFVAMRCNCPKCAVPIKVDGIDLASLPVPPPSKGGMRKSTLTVRAVLRKPAAAETGSKKTRISSKRTADDVATKPLQKKTKEKK